MPVDVSSYQQEQTSPFETLGKLTSIQNQANQNRLFQQQFQSNLGKARAYKEAFNPDGTINPAKLNALAAQDPNVSMGMGDIYRESQEAQGRNIGNTRATVGLQGDQLKNATDNFTTLNNYVTPLLAKPNVTRDDVYQTAVEAVTAGHVKPEIVSQLLSGMPQNDAEVPAWLKQHQLTLEQIKGSLFGEMNPTPQMVSTPQGQIPYSMPQVGQPHSVGAMIPNIPGPTTQRYNPETRQMEYVGNLPSGGTATGGGNAQGVGLAPGTAASAPFGTTEDSSRSVQAFNNLQDRNTTAPIRINQIREALIGIRSAATGPGTDYVNAVKRFAITQAPEISKSIGINADEVVSRDKADKYMTQYANNASAAFGPSTDARLASTITGNANSHIANLAADQVLVANMALEKMAQTQAAAFLATGKPKAGFLDWSSKWNNAADVRGFMLEDMPAKERIDMLTKLKKSKPGEYNNVMNSFQAAVDAGIIQPSNIPK